MLRKILKILEILPMNLLLKNLLEKVLNIKRVMPMDLKMVA